MMPDDRSQKTRTWFIDTSFHDNCRAVWSSLGRTTLTAATSEYNEESERAVVSPYPPA
jgi:hypothetical protein